MKKIVEKIEEVAKGNLDINIENKTNDEFGELISCLNKMITKQKETKEELEDAKNTLEIRITARTRELKELAENLENQVKERTRELQNKIDELEKFRKLVVGRELKMIELKKEIKKLKEEMRKNET